METTTTKSTGKIEVKTNVVHNISDFDFKLAVAKTADLIKYCGQDYLDKLNALNNQYLLKTKYNCHKEEDNKFI